MKGIPPELNNQLIKILIECGSFTSNQELTAIFVDSRITAFAASLPESANMMSRVNNIIFHLHNKYDTNNQNALVLFLYVLLDRMPDQTACYQKIAQFIPLLEKEVGEQNQTISPDSPNHVSSRPPINLIPDHNINHDSTRIFEILRNRFNEEEIKTLCFLLDIEFEELAGGNLSGKVRELVKFLNRREHLHILVSKIKQIRPDISW